MPIRSRMQSAPSMIASWEAPSRGGKRPRSLRVATIGRPADLRDRVPRLLSLRFMEDCCHALSCGAIRNTGKFPRMRVVVPMGRGWDTAFTTVSLHARGSTAARGHHLYIDGSFPAWA